MIYLIYDIPHFYPSGAMDEVVAVTDDFNKAKKFVVDKLLAVVALDKVFDYSNNWHEFHVVPVSGNVDSQFVSYVFPLNQFVHAVEFSSDNNPIHSGVIKLNHILNGLSDDVNVQKLSDIVFAKKFDYEDVFDIDDSEYPSLWRLFESIIQAYDDDYTVTTNSVNIL